MQKDSKGQTYLQVKTVFFKQHRCPKLLMQFASMCSIMLCTGSNQKDNLEGSANLTCMFLVCGRRNMNTMRKNGENSCHIKILNNSSE